MPFDCDTVVYLISMFYIQYFWTDRWQYKGMNVLNVKRYKVFDSSVRETMWPTKSALVGSSRLFWCVLNTFRAMNCVWFFLLRQFFTFGVFDFFSVWPRWQVRLKVSNVDPALRVALVAGHLDLAQLFVLSHYLLWFAELAHAELLWHPAFVEPRALRRFHWLAVVVSTSYILKLYANSV